MDWLHSSGGAPSLMLIPLGTYYNNQYHTSDQCLRYLEDLTSQLNCDDVNHSRRRGLGYVDILNTDLKPIMVISYRSWPKLFRSTVKLLVGITTPIECFAYDRTPDQRANSYVTYELEQLLYKAKESFLDPCATRPIIDHAKLLLMKQPLSEDEIKFLNLSLLLIRNILDAPERPMEPGPQKLPYSPIYSNKLENCEEIGPQQNAIVCNLFAQGLGRLLLDMLACPQMDTWMVTIIEVIAAIYKDQPVENIQAQLKILMESSEDMSFDQDPKNNLPCHTGVELQPPFFALMPKLSVISNAASNSTPSGGEQEIKKKRQGPAKKPDSRKSDRILMKDLSIEQAISQPLIQFTIDFMLNGYSIIFKQLKRKDYRLLERSHLLWLLVNFLPFASQMGHKPECLKEVLTMDLLCYLAWVVVRETEKVQLNATDATVDLKLCLRRLSLGIRAIFEYLWALEKYSSVEQSDSDKNQFDQCDRKWVFQLRRDVMAMKELRQLFLLQLYLFNSDIQTHQCLCDIILANYALILTIERATQQPECNASFDLTQHLNEFCTSAITARYGTALQEFRTNDHLVNDSILTMLHCIGCDMGGFDLLRQPIILRPLCKIWEEEFEICNDWHDLIERLVQKSMANEIDAPDKFSTQPSGRELPSNENLQFMESDQQPFTTLAEHQIVVKQDPLNDSYGDIESLICQLTINGYRKQLAWIQSSLLTACATRLGTYAGEEFRYPVSCSSMIMKIPCPMVPWTELEASGLRSEPFRCLLQQMGLIPHFPQSFLYPKIPSEWSADILFSFSLLFGPINDYDFDLTLVKKVNLPTVPNF